MDNKRKKTRVNFDTQVIIKTDTSEVNETGDLKNLSLKGMFVKSKKKLPKDSTCQTEIILSGSSSNLRLKITGTVIHNTDDGFGIRFDAMDTDSYFHLKNIIMYNSPEPASILKDMFL